MESSDTESTAKGAPPQKKAATGASMLVGCHEPRPDEFRGRHKNPDSSCREIIVVKDHPPRVRSRHSTRKQNQHSHSTPPTRYQSGTNRCCHIPSGSCSPAQTITEGQQSSKSIRSGHAMHTLLPEVQEKDSGTYRSWLQQRQRTPKLPTTFGLCSYPWKHRPRMPHRGATAPRCARSAALIERLIKKRMPSRKAQSTSPSELRA